MVTTVPTNMDVWDQRQTRTSKKRPQSCRRVQNVTFNGGKYNSIIKLLKTVRWCGSESNDHQLVQQMQWHQQPAKTYPLPAHIPHYDSPKFFSGYSENTAKPKNSYKKKPDTNHSRSMEREEKTQPECRLLFATKRDGREKRKGESIFQCHGCEDVLH
jgi:hypothetical protein